MVWSEYNVEFHQMVNLANVYYFFIVINPLSSLTWSGSIYYNLVYGLNIIIKRGKPLTKKKKTKKTDVWQHVRVDEHVFIFCGYWEADLILEHPCILNIFSEEKRGAKATGKSLGTQNKTLPVSLVELI